jgi:hypothetical protein
MRIGIYALLALVGVVAALLGDEPLWLPAVAALLAFPIAAAVADRESKAGSHLRTAPALPAAVTALTGGFLTALALRLALNAPGWLSTTAADCGGASTGVQQLVLWGGAVVFFLAAFPIAATTFTIGRRFRPSADAEPASPPLALYPVAVALSGLALIAAGYVTTC